MSYSCFDVEKVELKLLNLIRNAVNTFDECSATERLDIVSGIMKARDALIGESFALSDYELDRALNAETDG